MTDPPPVVRRIQSGRASTVIPPLDPSWTPFEKLRWLAAVVEADTGLRCRVHDHGSGYSINVGVTSVGSGPFVTAWSALTGVSLGAREVLGAAPAPAAQADPPEAQSGGQGQVSAGHLNARSCPSALRDGRQDRCGLLSTPPRCAPGACTAPDESPVHLVRTFAGATARLLDHIAEDGAKDLDERLAGVDQLLGRLRRERARLNVATVSDETPRAV